MTVTGYFLLAAIVIVFIYLIRVGGDVMREETRLKRKIDSYPNAGKPSKIKRIKRPEYDDTENFYHQ